MDICRHILYYNIILYNVGIIFREENCVNIIYTIVIFDSMRVMNIKKGLQ